MTQTRLVVMTLVLFGLFAVACGDDGQSGDGGGDGFVNNASNNDTENNDDNNDGGDEEEPFVVTWETFEERPCPDDNTLNYQNFGRSFMLNWCTGCHSTALPEGERGLAPVGVDLDKIADIRAQAERIWVRSADDNLGMPPVSGPSDEERFLLGQWLACGAP